MQKIPDPADEEKDVMNRDQYVEMLKARLDEWNGQISKAEVQIKDASDDMKARYEEQLAEMTKQAEAAQDKIQSAIQTHSEDWEKHRANMETAWNDIAEGFTKAWSRFS